MNTTQKKYSTIAVVVFLAFIATLVALKTAPFSGLRGSVANESTDNPEGEVSCRDIFKNDLQSCEDKSKESMGVCEVEHMECTRQAHDIHESLACDARRHDCYNVLRKESELCLAHALSKRNACEMEKEKPEVCEAVTLNVIAECNASYETSVAACDAQYPSSPTDAAACRNSAKSVFSMCTEAAEETKVRCITDPTIKISDPTVARLECSVEFLKYWKTCNEKNDEEHRECKRRYPEKTPERNTCSDVAHNNLVACYKTAGAEREECLNLANDPDSSIDPMSQEKDVESPMDLPAPSLQNQDSAFSSSVSGDTASMESMMPR